MADSGESEPGPRSRRRRQQSGEDGTGLTVAQLLARHSAPDADPAAAKPRSGRRATADAEPDLQPGSGPDSDAGSTVAAAEEPLCPDRGSKRPPPAADDTEQFVLGGGVPPTKSDDSPTDLLARVRDAIPESAAPKTAAPDAAAADGLEQRTRQIDESLVRLTAIHAGLGAAMTDRVSGSSRLDAVDGDGPSVDDPPGGEPGTAAGDGTPPNAVTRAGKLVLVGLAVLMFAGTALGWSTKTYLDAKLRSVAALDLNSESIVDKAGQTGDENYLLVGSDSRAGIDSDTAATDRTGSEKAVPGARADTVMVAHIPAKRDRVVLVSFPRDLEVDRPGCDRWDTASASYPGGTSPAQRDVKLNTAFEIGGPRCVTKVIQKITGLSINHFTAIDFAGFKEMVDSVAGVPICLDRPVVDSVLGRVVPTAGETVLAGDQALAFVRARHVRGDPTSDYGRIQRQQRFLSALLRKGLSEQVLLNPAKLRAFVTAFGNHTLSDNAGLDELTTLGGSLRNIDPAKVTFVTVPTQGEPDQDGNEVLRKNDTDALFAAIRSDLPLPGEATEQADDARAVTQPSDANAPSRVTLAVRNGSAKTGLANEVADSMRSVGFKISRVEDAEPRTKTVVRHSPDRAEDAATVAAAVPGAEAKETPGPAGVLELVLGDNYDGEVKAPVGADARTGSDLPANLSTVNGADASCR